MHAQEYNKNVHTQYMHVSYTVHVSVTHSTAAHPVNKPLYYQF